MRPLLYLVLPKWLTQQENDASIKQALDKNRHQIVTAYDIHARRFFTWLLFSTPPFPTNTAVLLVGNACLFFTQCLRIDPALR
jgi:hypothetical protein